MTARDFCFWLQGFYEIHNANAPTPALSPEQSDMIRRHLALVFKHEIDPATIPVGSTAEEMQSIHDGPKPPLNAPVAIAGWPKPPGGDTLYRC